MAESEPRIMPPSDILEKINKALADLGSTAKWRRAPEFLEEYKPLKNKRIVMVDDTKDLLTHFAPYLLVATDGDASFVEYTGQNAEELIEQILSNTPDIVVMDYHLSIFFKGSDATKALRAKNFSGPIIGFSSDKDTANKFLSAGATGMTDKNTGYPEESVGKIAQLVSGGGK